MNRLYYLRKQKGLTQSQLGEVLSISQQTVSRIEKIKGSEVPTDLLVKLSDYYQFSVDYLIESDKDMEAGSEELEEMAKIYRRLNSYNKETLMIIGKRLLTEQKNVNRRRE